MNILPKKKWHVRTKENMARVRKDEAEAAKAEEARLERVRLAEQERRLQSLKGTEKESPQVEAVDSNQVPSTSKHLNFFAELEEQERKNTTSGNKEYQQEKKAEFNAWESKMGIMKKFAEDTMELSKGKHWWESIERVKVDSPSPVPKKVNKEKKMKSKKHKKRRRHRSSSSESDDPEVKRRRLQQLREERLNRETAEKARAAQLTKSHH